MYLKTAEEYIITNRKDICLTLIPPSVVVYGSQFLADKLYEAYKC